VLNVDASLGMLRTAFANGSFLRSSTGKSDPYVKFELEQDNMVMDKHLGEKRSSVKKGECSPVYNETFTWEVSTMNNM